MSNPQTQVQILSANFIFLFNRILDKIHKLQSGGVSLDNKYSLSNSREY